ncbi:hypothetical protein F5Y00DRAFT_264946 [Daldinia vernicosa]|uniref:uncharacterized protein n=1 Tax=Daldinia vernicosa TaxID=114800 RepID=UPI002007219C|nr:uncharacterized protein F5Y00DRAFT_264946 [Daldinia vernicosa]KAI0846052.1 hypothetical protein F5Y00DRAFT_264946 [Daldinia vernicosa]
MAALPQFAPFPEASWRNHIVPDEWETCLANWLALVEAHLSLSEDQFTSLSAVDGTLLSFLVSFVAEASANGATVLGTSPSAKLLFRQCFILVARLLRMPSPPPPLLRWEFLSDFSRLFPKKRTSILISQVSQKLQVTNSLTVLKKSLIVDLDSGLKGDLRTLESQLRRLNHLIHASPDVAAFFLAGSDFLDGLISCYKIMNPPLRKTIVTTAYLCLIGLTEGNPPNFSMLTDQLYSLKAAADSHKAGPLNVNDSMVAELVTVTPILKQVQHRFEESGSSATRWKSIIVGLEGFRKPGGNARPKKMVKRKIDKGKGIMTEDDDVLGEMKIHRMSQISQIQDLFPNLGSGFVSRLLDEYEDNTERIIAHLLEDSLPAHLAAADRTEELSQERSRRKSRDIAPRPTPPLSPSTRHNVFDDDEFDKLAVDMSNIHFGKRNPEKSADDILNDRSSAPNKAAILSALSAFDADDDERDDTYDVADAGLVVNDGNPEDADDQKRKDASEEALFRAYQSDSKVFGRDAATRRGQSRSKLKQQTGMTDEAIEGWALMLTRTPHQMRQLEMKYSAFSGDQPALAPTAWRASPAESAAEDSEIDGGGNNPNNPRGGSGVRGRGRGGRGRGRGGGRGGNVAGPSGDKDTESARRRKEANKGSRANHNRRDQRARKMARGGLAG